MGISTCLSTTLDGGVLVAIEVQPKASTQGIIGFNAWRNRISVAVKAEAKNGQANRAVLHVMSKTLDVPSSELTIVFGHTSRQKSIRVSSLGIDDLLACFHRALETSS